MPDCKVDTALPKLKEQWVQVFRIGLLPITRKAFFTPDDKTSMVDHNALRERLVNNNSFRQLRLLKGEIERSKGQLPFSIFTDLLSRTEEKIRTMEYPICSTARITVSFSNGLDKVMDTAECLVALADGGSLSNYIFSRYPSAGDYKMDTLDLTGTMSREGNSVVEEEEEEDNPFKSSQSRPIEMIDVEVRTLSARVDKMEQTMSEELPKLNRKMNDLEVKMDYLYHHFAKDKS